MCPKKFRVGFVGGGQLAMMTAQEARRLNAKSRAEYEFAINILDPTPACPADRFADAHVVAGFKDPEGLGKLAEMSDIITYEIELGSAKALTSLHESGTRILPSPKTLGLIQDKFVQKEFLRSKGIPVARHIAVEGPEEVVQSLSEFGYPAMLKSRRDSYDGRGTALVRGPREASAVAKRLVGRGLMLEEVVPWEKEVSVISARGVSGESAAFPLGENIHLDGILQTTILPAQAGEDVRAEAERVALRVMEAFGDCGVFGVEMFDCGGKILVNEVAPRVHNSGHGTLEHEAFGTSQFEQHLRAISGLPLGDTSIRRPVVMQNILGERDVRPGPYVTAGVREAERLPGVHVHMYGKREVKPRRKMGHLSVVGEKRLYEERVIRVLVERAAQARELIKLVEANSDG